MSMISIRGLTKAFGARVIFDNFSADIPANHITFISAPSGRGKSTLFHILLGLEPYQAGEIRGMPEKKGVAFQADCLCEQLSVIDNIRLVHPSLATTDILACLDKVGLLEDKDKKASELSGGMKRRLAVCRAMLSDAPILLLDEPFAGLDQVSKEKTIAMMEEYRHNRTLLIISHDPDDIQMMQKYVSSPVYRISL